MLIGSQVAARSRQLLIEYNSPSAEQRRALFVSAVKAVTAAAAEGDNHARQSAIDSFVSQRSWLPFCEVVSKRAYCLMVLE